MPIHPSYHGKLLIAEPFLGDPHFERSVIVICDHDEEGALGIIVNQSIEGKLRVRIRGNMTVMVGGPVMPTTLLALHTNHDLGDGSFEVAEGLWFMGDAELINQSVTEGSLHENNGRLFLGYAGWGAGQLEAEMDEKAWIARELPRPLERIFTTPALWQAALKEMGGTYKQLANYPKDPRLN